MKRIESAGLLAKGQEDASLKGETHQRHAEIHCEVWSCDISAHRWSSTDWIRCSRDIETVTLSHIRDRHRQNWPLLCRSGCPITYRLPLPNGLCDADLGNLQGVSAGTIPKSFQALT